MASDCNIRGSFWKLPLAAGPCVVNVQGAHPPDQTPAGDRQGAGGVLSAVRGRGSPAAHSGACSRVPRVGFLPAPPPTPSPPRCFLASSPKGTLCLESLSQLQAAPTQPAQVWSPPISKDGRRLAPVPTGAALRSPPATLPSGRCVSRKSTSTVVNH